MAELTDTQKEKLARVSKITGVDQDAALITDARKAVAFAKEHKLLDSWTDIGHHYVFSFLNAKQITVRPFAVGELIVDRFLQLKDPIHETVSVESKEVKEITKRIAKKVVKASKD
jgi:hypothetical protein